MIVNDPSRKDDDPTYLLEKFDQLTSGCGFDSVEILTLRDHEESSDIVFEDYEQWTHNRIRDYRCVSEDFHNFKEYAQTCDYLLVMPNGLIDGIPGALINAFNRYNQPTNVYTF